MSTDTDVNKKLKDLPGWLTLGFVSAMVVVYVGLYFLYPRGYELLQLKEGPVEYATVLVLLPGIVAGLLAFRLRRRFPARWLGVWMLLCALGLFYFAGEELSWGQHVFGWDGSKVMESNRQGETNLHNYGPFATFFGRKPKQLVEVWTIACCIALPLWLAWKKVSLNPKSDWGYWFWPTGACMLSAILATLVYLPTRILKAVTEGDINDMFRFSELQEYYFALTLSIYVLSIWHRLRQMPGVEPRMNADEHGWVENQPGAG